MRTHSKRPLMLLFFLVLMSVQVASVRAEITPVKGNIVNDVSELTELYETIIPLGSQAPQFKLKDLKGKVWDSDDYLGQNLTILYFWSAFCPYCKQSLPKINALYDKYKPMGLKALAINLDGMDFVSPVTNFIREHNVTLPVPLDELTSVKKYFRAADPYGVNKTPTVFLINTSNEVIFAGEIDYDYGELEKLIQKNLGNVKKKVTVVISALVGIAIIALLLFFMFIRPYSSGKKA